MASIYAKKIVMNYDYDDMLIRSIFESEKIFRKCR